MFSFIKSREMQIKTVMWYYLVCKIKRSQTIHWALTSSWGKQHRFHAGFQSSQPPKVRNVLHKATRYKHVKLTQEVNKTIITHPTCNAIFYFLFILFHNWLNCFHYPLMRYKLQSKKHSLENHPLANKKKHVQGYWWQHFFPINRGLDKRTRCNRLTDD